MEDAEKTKMGPLLSGELFGADRISYITVPTAKATLSSQSCFSSGPPLNDSNHHARCFIKQEGQDDPIFFQLLGASRSALSGTHTGPTCTTYQPAFYITHTVTHALQDMYSALPPRGGRCACLTAPKLEEDRTNVRQHKTREIYQQGAKNSINACHCSYRFM